MINVLKTAGAMLVAMFALTSLSKAQPSYCWPREQVLEFLSEKHGERPVMQGLANNNHVLEVLASPGGESWTIMITRPDGISCLQATGSHIYLVPERGEEKEETPS